MNSVPHEFYILDSFLEQLKNRQEISKDILADVNDYYRDGYLQCLRECIKCLENELEFLYNQEIMDRYDRI